VSFIFLYFYTIDRSGYEQQLAKKSERFFNFNYIFPFFKFCTQYAPFTLVHNFFLLLDFGGHPDLSSVSRAEFIKKHAKNFPMNGNLAPSL
jgi:hypothetical protein